MLVRYRKAASSSQMLVVDDDPQIRYLLRRALEKAGWQVAEAADGREGLEAVAASRPALILLDLMMPGMDGFEFMQELRRKPGCELLPVVVITSLDLTEEDRQRLNGHVAEILKKGSYRMEDLLRQIQGLVAGDWEV